MASQQPALGSKCPSGDAKTLRAQRSLHQQQRLQLEELDPMNSESQMLVDLRSQLAINTDLLGHLERESQHLRQVDAPQSSAASEARKQALPKLDAALQRIRQHRNFWLSLSPEVRSTKHEIRELLRQNQDLIMRLIILDRENEQLLLRRGLIPPKHLPPAQRQRPHYVADMYRRNHSTGNPAGTKPDEDR